MSTLPPSTADTLLVTCLCAQWCVVCGDFAAEFEAVRTLFPQARFLWIDVEDEEDLVDPIAVDNFPTLLVALGDAPVFFGPVMPRRRIVERLLHTHLAPQAARGLERADLYPLVARLRQLQR